MPTTTATAAVLGEETSEVFLTLLEITRADGSLIRLVRDTVDVTSGGNLYKAFPFDLTYPNQTDDEPRATLQVANIDQVIGEEIQALTDPAPILFKRVLASSPSTVEDSYPGYELFDVTWDTTVLEGTLTQARYVHEPWPAKRITPDKYRSIFL